MAFTNNKPFTIKNTREIMNSTINKILLTLSSIICIPAIAADLPEGIIGKNEWLYYRYEITNSTYDENIKQSISLIKDFNKILSSTGIRLVVAIIPIKMRIYSEHMPDDLKIDPFTDSNYSRMLEYFRANDVFAVDINTAFLTDPNRAGDSPLFFRLDSHWTPSGAMAAAKAINIAAAQDTESKKILDSIQQVSYSIKVATRKRPSKGRDLIGLLPSNAPNFQPELVAQVNVTKAQPANPDLLGNQTTPLIALLGSSYSKEWTGFADALRFVMQRDVSSVAVAANQGSWIGMESFLRDEAFQKNPPKLLIWEMPERDMKAPPDYKYREARYILDNKEWLKRVTTLVKSSATRH
jgi:alginate O-acetyltransferase complex protein AlgJ